MKPLIKKEFKEIIRTGRLWIILAVFGFFAVLSPVTARYMPEIFESLMKDQHMEFKIPDPTWMDAMMQYVKNLSQICTFILIFLFMGSVAREKESGTAVFIIVKPVLRAHFILSKFILAWVSITLSIFISFLLASFYTYLFFGDFPVYKFAVANLILLLNLLVITSLVIFFSTISKTQLVAALLSFLSWLVLGLIAQIRNFGYFSPSKLIGESMDYFSGNSLHWQAFAGSAFMLFLSVAWSIFAFRKWEA